MSTKAKAVSEIKAQINMVLARLDVASTQEEWEAVRGALVSAARQASEMRRRAWAKQIGAFLKASGVR